MSVARSSEGAERRAQRNLVGPPPWSKEDRNRLVQRVRRLANQRATKLAEGPIGPMEDFVGYDGAALVAHLADRYEQGCLICGNDITAAERFEVCHIDPLALAFDPSSLAALMALSNIGLSHIACNVRLGPRPLR